MRGGSVFKAGGSSNTNGPCDCKMQAVVTPFTPFSKVLLCCFRVRRHAQGHQAGNWGPQTLEGSHCVLRILVTSASV